MKAYSVISPFEIKNKVVTVGSKIFVGEEQHIQSSSRSHHKIRNVYDSNGVFIGCIHRRSFETAVFCLQETI